MALKQKITNASIKKLSTDEQRINDTEVSGFHARISPKGHIKYYLFYRLNGKQRNFLLGSASSLTPAQARDLAKEQAGLVASGKDIQQNKLETRQREATLNLKLNTFLENKYLPYLNAQNPKTAHKAYKNITSSFAFLLDKNISDISAWDIQQWVAERRKIGRAPSTLTYSIGRLKAALNRAVEWGLIESHNLNKIRVVREDNTRIRYLTSAEETVLLKAVEMRDEQVRAKRVTANQHRYERNKALYPTLEDVRFVDYFEPLILTAINTGLRRGELLSLKWSDVSLDHRYLTVKAENAKSKKSRTIPLNHSLFTALQLWHKQNTKAVYVFSPYSDKPITDIKKPWMRLLEQAEITDFRFHDLRHHFASKLVMAGVDLNTVRELLGHSDLKMTLRYAHLAPEHKAAAVNLIG
ncbi:site-specific integrase [Vibrio tapetis]|uniref:Integrase n=1 Tax=Vibrio tapetis subsp. tapetis TaxID=1671868 RepID=A0A2N8ZBS8_9VIBR|nr:site-specific integrase [Vibrio tapetis]SON49366.1 Integrase [Vibrio tapetis subsp. tapetis]